MFKIGIAVVAVLLAGCTVSGPDPILAIGVPNPASVYCIERAGTLDIKQSAAGDVSMCDLSDGTRVEEWELYRRNHPKD